MTVDDYEANLAVQLEFFEKLVYERLNDDAVSEMLMILRRFRAGGDIAGHALGDSTRPAVYSRLAASISALISDPNFQPSPAAYDKLAIEHSVLSALFSNSAFRNGDYLFQRFAVPAQGANSSSALTEIGPRMLLSYSLESELEIDLVEIFRQAPQSALPFYLGMLSQPVALSAKAHARRNRLLAACSVFDDCVIEEHMVDAVAQAYFDCSYSDLPTKHQLKRTLNKILRRFINARIPSPDVPKRPRLITSRPTLLVATERFTSVHSVYRCVAPYMDALREKFRVVAIGPASQFDSQSRTSFEKVVGLPGDQVSFPDLLANVKSISPDILLCPSVGMSPWCVAMSNVRLAPIQVTSIGHPATTHSSEMDYFLIPEAMAGKPSTFSETAVLYEGCLSVVDRADANFPRAEIRDRADPIRIAVPAAAMKLTPSFMASCKAIQGRSPRLIQFHFFPHLAGMSHYWIGNQIKQWIPDATVYPAAAYNEYLAHLAACDIQLSTFPFGGMNSNIDSMRLGIPIVTLEGPESHNRTDAGMMRAVGLPEWLIARNVEDYAAAAIRLIDNDDERVDLSRRLVSMDVGHVFSDRDSHRNARDFLAALWFVYTRHEEIGRSGRKYWTVSDRNALAT